MNQLLPKSIALYNLKDDPAEIFDLSSEKDNKVTEMENNYNAAQKRFKAETYFK